MGKTTFYPSSLSTMHSLKSAKRIQKLCLCIDTCCISVTTSLGFGRHAIDIDPKVLPYLGLIGNFSGLFAILAAIFSKISFALTLLRISNFRTRILLWFIIASVSLSLGGSALILWIQCTPLSKNWDFTAEGTCWNHQVYITYGVASGGLSDSCLFRQLADFTF